MRPAPAAPPPAATAAAVVPAFAGWLAAAVLVVFIVLSLPALQSDLWFDEIITLQDYAGQEWLGDIFRSYRHPNNHMLFSALLWTWVRGCGTGNETLLRLPCLLLALATLWLCYVHGRRLFGHPAGGLVPLLLLAFSPVYLNFHVQLRGYSLTILLATVATVGALYAVSGQPARGTVMYAAGALLLPAVIPTNLLVNLSLLAFVTLAWRLDGRWRARRWWLAAMALAAVGGMLVYAPIAPKFLRVVRETEGWDSGWLAAGHWLLAATAHVGLFVLASLVWRRQAGPAPAAAPPAAGRLPRLGLLALCCAVPMLLVLVWRAPFPRSLLGYLPPLTFAALWCFPPRLPWRNQHYYLLLLLVLGNLLGWSRGAEYLNARDRQRGVIRQNLIEQYYMRSRDVSTTMAYLARRLSPPPATRIFVDFHFYLAARLYWQQAGGSLSQVECLNGPDTGPFALGLPPARYAELPLLVLAYDARSAARGLRARLGREIPLEPLPSPTGLTIFRVVGAGGSQAPAPAPAPTVPDDNPPN